MAFNTAGYHSYINDRTAAGLGHPSGDVPDIHFGTGDRRVGLSGMAALYPVDFWDDPRFSPGWLVVPGLSLWTAYRLEINPAQGYLALEPVRNSNYSEADFAFYSAAAAEDRAHCKTICARTRKTATWPRRPGSCSRWAWRTTHRSRSRWRRWSTACPRRWSA